MLLCLLGGEPSPGIWKMLRCGICCLCFFGVWHMEDAKMCDLLSLFWPLPLAYWKFDETWEFINLTLQYAVSLLSERNASM